MNNRQAGAYRELVRKEERAREMWMQNHGHHLQALKDARQQQLLSGTAGFPQSPYEQQQAQFQPAQSFAQTSNNFAPSQSFGATVGGASLPLAPSSIYEQALRISSPRLQQDASDVDVPATVQRRVVRQVEVPFTRQVKVPVTTRQLVPVLVEKKVKTRKLVEVPSTKLVSEDYTEVIQQPAIRSKEIWVKQLVPERYQQPRTIQRTRQVTVPTTVLRAVDDYEVVRVTENRAIEVPGYRIDEVQDSKLVEVEELQNYALQPVSNGQAQVLAARDVGPIAGFHHSRRIGTEVYHPLDARHSEIEEDGNPFSGKLQQRPYSASAAPRSSTFRPNFGVSQRYAASRPQQFSQSQTLAPTTDNELGFKARDGDANGVTVYRVAPNEAAERAGLRTGDVVLYVNNRPSRNVVEFRSVLAASTGPVYLQVRRRGVQKLMLTLHR